jgi:hypothetical protein
MPLVIADRVRETTTTSGTGTLTLAGPYSGFQAFSVIGNGNTTYYAIIDAQNGAWEVGIGAYTTSGNTLSRATVLASSNAGSLVNFGAGTKDVILTQPARRSVLVQEGGSGLLTGVAAFTANGVPYANSTSTLTTGSALTFDGAGFGVGGNASGGVRIYTRTATSTGTAFQSDNGVNTGFVVRYEASTTLFGNDFSQPLAFLISDTEQMRLTTTGLGIGTSSPAYKLDVSGSVARIKSSSAYSGLGLWSDDTNTSTRNWLIASSYNNYGDLCFVQSTTQGGNPLGGTVRAVLDPSGNLGIGTSSPGYKLEVRGEGFVGTAANSGIRLLNSGGVNYIQSGNAGAAAPLHLGNWFGNGFAVLDSAGNLGIGTSSPTGKLTIKQGAAQIDVTTGANSVIFESLDRGNLSAAVDTLFYSRFGKYQWFTGSYSEAMHLDAPGNLGLGVAPSAWKSGWKAFQNQRSALVSDGVRTGLSYNWFLDSGSTDRYIANDFANLYQQASGQHQWFNAPSGTAGNAISFTQAMTLDASGNLLLGGTSNFLGARAIIENAAGNQVGIRYTGVATYYLDVTSGGSLVISKDAAERLTIDSSGNLLVGTTSAPDVANIESFAFERSGGRVVCNGKNANTVIDVNQTFDDTDARGAIRFFRNETQVGSISVSTSATAYNTSSDYRLKNTIAPMTGALAKVALLKPCTYKWNADGSDGEGFIAHELAEVVPQCVTGEKDAVDAEGKPQYQGIDTSFLVATLTAAIQELKAEFDAYKASHP